MVEGRVTPSMVATIVLHLLTETLAIFSRASSLGRKCSSAEPWTQTNSITSILLASVFTQDHLYLTTALSIKLKLEQLHCLLGHFKGITTDIKLSKQELSTPPPMYTSRVEGKAMSGHRSENHSPNCTKGPGTPVTMCGLRGVLEYHPHIVPQWVTFSCYAYHWLLTVKASWPTAVTAQ